MGGSGDTDLPAALVFARTRPQPAAVDQIRPHVGRTTAVGRLYIPHGEPLTPPVGPGDTGAGDTLTEPLRSMRFVTHVESNATALMRRNGIRHAVLYLNMRPCLGEDGCTENIKSTLPTGSRLTVYQVQANGGVRVWQFDGTSEGLIDDDRP